MRTFVVALIGFFLLIAGTFIYVHFLTEAIDVLDNNVDDLIMHTENEKWEETQLSYNKFQSQWAKSKKWFSIFINHEEMDMINETLYKLEGYVHFQDKKEIIVNANVLKILLRHIPENESLTIENILCAKNIYLKFL